MERALGAGEALADDFGILVDKNGHGSALNSLPFSGEWQNGGWLQRATDFVAYTVKILTQFMISETDHSNALLIQKSRARSIIAEARICPMLVAVEFDRQFGRCAIEVQDIGANRMLTAKSKPVHLRTA